MNILLAYFYGQLSKIIRNRVPTNTMPFLVIFISILVVDYSLSLAQDYSVKNHDEQKISSANTKKTTGTKQRPQPTTQILKTKQKVTEPNQAGLPHALTKVNTSFIESLRQEIDKELKDFGPALLFERNVLKLIRHGKVVAEEPAAPTMIYHQLKSYSHMCMTVVIKLIQLKTESERIKWAEKYILDVEAAQNTATQLGLPSSIAARQIAISSLTHRFLEENIQSRGSAERLAQYIEEVQPLIIQNLEVAAADHIAQLDSAVKKLMALLSEKEKQELQAFTYGSKGPRGQNLIVQYFAHLVGQEELVESTRVVYGEGLKKQSEILKVMSKFNIEQALGLKVFNDPLRLQNDVLAEGAKNLLEKRKKNTLTIPRGEKLLQTTFKFEADTNSELPTKK